MEDGHLGYRVRLVRPYGEFRVGIEGDCTADLPDEDVYAVWFDETVLHPLLANPTRWVRFEHAAKGSFEVTGMSSPETVGAMAIAKGVFKMVEGNG